MIGWEGGAIFFFTRHRVRSNFFCAGLSRRHGIFWPITARRRKISTITDLFFQNRNCSKWRNCSNVKCIFLSLFLQQTTKKQIRLNSKAGNTILVPVQCTSIISWVRRGKSWWLCFDHSITLSWATFLFSDGKRQEPCVTIRQTRKPAKRGQTTRFHRKRSHVFVSKTRF